MYSRCEEAAERHTALRAYPHRFATGDLTPIKAGMEALQHHNRIAAGVQKS